VTVKPWAKLGNIVAETKFVPQISFQIPNVSIAMFPQQCFLVFPHWKNMEKQWKQTNETMSPQQCFLVYPGL
jgi:hypothetical protein